MVQRERLVFFFFVRRPTAAGERLLLVIMLSVVNKLSVGRRAAKMMSNFAGRSSGFKNKPVKAVTFALLFSINGPFSNL